MEMELRDRSSKGDGDGEGHMDPNITTNEKRWDMRRKRGWVQRMTPHEDRKKERRQEIKQQKHTYHSLSSDVRNTTSRTEGKFLHMVQRLCVCVKGKESGEGIFD